VLRWDPDDIEDFTLPPETPQTSSDLGDVSLQMLKDWGSEAKDDAKDILEKAADLEQKLGDMKIAGSEFKDLRAAGTAANDYATLLNNNSANAELVAGENMNAVAAAEDTNALGTRLEANAKVLNRFNNGVTVLRAANICANGTSDACDGAKAGGGLAIVANELPGAGLVLTTGAGLGSDGLRNVNKYNNVQYQACMDLNSGGCGGLQSFPSQEKLSQTAQGFFDATK
jgi:hypothetical protein